MKQIIENYSTCPLASITKAMTDKIYNIIINTNDGRTVRLSIDKYNKNAYSCEFFNNLFEMSDDTEEISLVKISVPFGYEHINDFFDHLNSRKKPDLYFINLYDYFGFKNDICSSIKTREGYKDFGKLVESNLIDNFISNTENNNNIISLLMPLFEQFEYMYDKNTYKKAILNKDNITKCLHNSCKNGNIICLANHDLFGHYEDLTIENPVIIKNIIISDVVTNKKTKINLKFTLIKWNGNMGHEYVCTVKCNNEMLVQCTKKICYFDGCFVGNFIVNDKYDFVVVKSSKSYPYEKTIIKNEDICTTLVGFGSYDLNNINAYFTLKE